MATWNNYSEEKSRCTPTTFIHYKQLASSYCPNEDPLVISRVGVYSYLITELKRLLQHLNLNRLIRNLTHYHLSSCTSNALLIWGSLKELFSTTYTEKSCPPKFIQSFLKEIILSSCNPFPLHTSIVPKPISTVLTSERFSV